MTTNRITIFQEKCKKTGLKFQTAQLIDKAGDSHGQKYFITELGEIAHVNLFEKEKIPDAFNDLEFHYHLERKRHEKSMITSLNEVWRYFSDQSIGGKDWYLETMSYHKDCYDPGNFFVSEILEKKEIHTETQQLKYTTWESLNKEMKEKCMSLFFKNPIRASHPIINHIYNELGLR